MNISTLIEKEAARQRDSLNLIASENEVSEEVRAALGSVFVNKYAEGYPGRRYYEGNETADDLETYVQKKALEVFGIDGGDWAVNVQPLSGAQANLAVYQSLVPHGEKIMALDLSQGGHLSHAYKVTLTGKLWKQVPYTINKETETLDYDELSKIAKLEKPALIVAGFTAYPREVDFEKFREIADAAGAHLHVDMSHFAGLVAGGVHQSPFPYADTVMTTTHKTLRGPRSAMIFSKKDFAAKIDKAVFPGLQGGPHMNQIAAVGVALEEALTPEFKNYAEQTVKNARALADSLSKNGLRLVSGGTDTHLVLVDTWRGGEGIPGDEAAERLAEEGIVTNKNTIPFDERSPMSPSGIRIGTPFETTRRKTEEDFADIGERIASILK